MNAISWIYLYISASKVKFRLFALRYIIGETSSCNRLSHQIGTPAPLEEENNTIGIQTRARTMIRLRSKFDYMGNVYEVVEELPNETIREVCKWGSLAGDEIFLNGSRLPMSLIFKPAELWQRFFVTHAASMEALMFILHSLAVSSRPKVLMTSSFTLA